MKKTILTTMSLAMLIAFAPVSPAAACDGHAKNAKTATSAKAAACAKDAKGAKTEADMKNCPMHAKGAESEAMKDCPMHGKAAKSSTVASTSAKKS